MASTWYTKGLKAVLNGTVDLLTNNLKMVLVDTGVYTADLDADEFYSTITGVSGNIAISGNLSGKTITIDTAPTPDQVMFDANDFTFTAVSGTTTEAVVLIYDTGVAGTSNLLCYYDGASVALTPNGNDVNCVISASGLARLARA